VGMFLRLASSWFSVSTLRGAAGLRVANAVQ
jgi:hypothetical protein